MAYPRISKMKSIEQFRARLSELDIVLPLDETLEAHAEAPLARPLSWSGGSIGNRFCILPMEGWDGTAEGKPTDLTRRRWKHFGLSGAKLIWGGEAVAVRHDGRANPNQLLLTEKSIGDVESLRELLIATHVESFGDASDLSVGLQLTHSGRFARPNDKAQLEPRTAYAHPLLDQQFGVDPSIAILSDDELKQLIDDFIVAAKRAAKAGFQWIDVKHCHGYLGHELLSGFDRAGEFGGSFENRTRFLRDVVSGVRAVAPELKLGVRVSIFDFVPFRTGPGGPGVPAAVGDYVYAWGGDGTGQGIQLDEPHRFLRLLTELGIELVCTTAGSPYYNPHIQRPALFPPSDGYQPPEDPLVGVARQIAATAELKSQHPEVLIVGSGYSYLQEWLPNVAQAAVRDGQVDSVGLGRMVLSYPDLPADVLSGKTLARKRICRTFSDCTTAPRNGIISGCFPLDPFYKQRAEFEELAAVKRGND